MGKVSVYIFQVVVAFFSFYIFLVVGYTSEVCYFVSWIYRVQEDWFELEIYEEGKQRCFSFLEKGKVGSGDRDSELD